VKELVSDGGGEFVNKEVDALLKEFGIEKHTTAPYNLA
jgi:transposase InsO family protein